MRPNNDSKNAKKQACLAMFSLEVRCISITTIRQRLFCFCWVDGKSRRRLGLCDIVTLVWIWLYTEMTVSQAAKAADVAKMTASEWFAKCRTVCSDTEMLLPKLAGTPTEPIQVDESYFAGRGKYKRGWLLRGDKKSTNEREARAEIELELSGWGVGGPVQL